ncbi:hypothetical protein D9611_007135 [Ephemerocybe angulata]|uniref:NmrA-like domain-containing protein n=1 Tax=Ephemerocybe angulata TaxID=980116 RepID=A0A8H5EWD5_9AGAR|nr:hypothetical protein D9611_007135 [Tulosesus angulatus]
MGKVHTYLDKQGLNYVALRPTWFVENLARNYGYFNAIQNTLPTGRVPLGAVEDIAQAVFDAIVNFDTLPSREPILTGLELVSYPEVHASSSPSSSIRSANQCLGFLIPGRRNPSQGPRTANHTWMVVKAELICLPDVFSQYLADIEEDLEGGSEARLLEDPRIIKGKIGVTQWIEAHKGGFDIDTLSLVQVEERISLIAQGPGSWTLRIQIMGTTSKVLDLRQKKD